MGNIKKYNEFYLDKIETAIKFLHGRYKDTSNRIFTYLLCKSFGEDFLFYVSKIEFSEDPRDIIDAFICFDNKYINATGIYIKDDIMKKYNIIPSVYKELTFTGDLTLLKKSITDNPLTKKKIMEIYNILSKIS